MNEVIYVSHLKKIWYVKENKSFASFFSTLWGRGAPKEIKAVDNISFTINRGECVSLTGRNGAGKSTTIKILTGILKSSGGEIRVLGRDPFKSRKQNNLRIAAVFGQRCQLRWDLSAMESFKLLKNIYQIQKENFETRLHKLDSILELEPFIHRPVRTLSMGQKMRAELCATFLHKPDIIFLDEPTIGLDIFSKSAILEFLKEVKKERDSTLFLTSHNIADIEELCERIMIIEEGRLAFDGRIEELEQQMDMSHDIVLITENLEPFLPPEFKASPHSLSPHKLEIQRVPKESTPQVLAELLKSNLVREIKIKNPRLEEVLKKFYASHLGLSRPVSGRESKADE